MVAYTHIDYTVAFTSRLHYEVIVHKSNYTNVCSQKVEVSNPFARESGHNTAPGHAWGFYTAAVVSIC